MCGIIGYVGQKECLNYLINGLKRLEYRGYDSSGVGIFQAEKKAFEVLKSEGKLDRIEALLQSQKKQPKGTIGIGHTRWATHGKPNSTNAHPHRAGATVLVHNGIIENYESIRADLLSKGAKLLSETDSELFAHMVEAQRLQGLSFEDAVQAAFLQLQGSCSIVVVNDEFPDRIVAVRNGTPLIVAHSKQAQGSFVASDAQAVLEHTREITFLENMELVICRKEGFEIYPLRKPLTAANKITRAPLKLDWEPASMEKSGFEHYMLKEIYEQPRAILDTIDSLMDRESGIPKMPLLGEMIRGAQKIQLLGCGTAWHAALVGKYLIEKVARIPVEVDLASEYRYREPIVNEHTLVLVVSQSGETADTLAALVEAKKRGAMTAAICNVRGSSIAREAGITLFTAAGPEIGVASTKAFTTQVLVFMMLAQYLAHVRGRPAPKFLDLAFYNRIPHQIQLVLALDAQIKKIAEVCMSKKNGFLFIGRNYLYPIALEGALKTKEITYVHAQGYPSGELKHGPIAMVDPEMTIVVLIPKDELYEKNLSNLQEVKARGGFVVAFGQKGDRQVESHAHHFIGIDFTGDWSDIFLATVPLQFLAYHSAVLRGTDVDKPRNLAKSVTVE